MAININTTLAGVDTREGRPTGKLRSTQLTNVCGDQALVYERITNKSAKGDGSAVAVGNTGNSHTTAGTLLYWPIMSQTFGDPEWDPNNASSSLNKKPVTLTASSGAEGINVILFYFPIWIPAGWANKKFSAYMVNRTKQSPLCRLTLETAIGTADTGQVELPFLRYINFATPGYHDSDVGSEDETYRAEFKPTTASSLRAVKVMTNIRSSTDTTANNREITEITIAPNPAAGPAMTAGAVPPGTSATYVDVGNPDAANAWNPVDATYTASNAPLGAALKLAAENDAKLQEMCFGFGAAGRIENTAYSDKRPTIATAGHDHSATGELGSGIEYCLGAWCFGPFNDGTAPYAGIIGNGADPPRTNNSIYRQVLRFNLQTPVSAQTTGGVDSKLKAACVVFQTYPGDKNTDGFVKLTLTPAGGVASSVEYRATVGGNGYLMLSSASTFSFKSGGLTEVKVEIKDAVGSTAINFALCGFCLYFDQ